jgi:uncharacterized membrane protein YciS (DUF1049 family)
MSIAVSFFILYLIPILTIVLTFGLYMLAYGKSADGIVTLGFFLALSGLITSCYLTTILVSGFVANKIVYSGVIFSIMGCLIEIAAFGFYILIYKDELRFIINHH